MQPRSSAVVAAALGVLLAGCPGCTDGDDAVDPGDGSSVESQTLLLTVGASGLSEAASFVVPADALSLHLTARAPGATGKLAFELSQDGQLRVSYQTPATADDALLSVHDELAWGTPASTASLARSPGGSWEVKLRHLDGALPAPVPVLAVWRRAGPPDRGEPRGRLTVSLVLVGADVAAEAAARRALDGAADLLDLPIDVAAVVHVDGAAAAPFATVDVSGGADATALRALFAQPLGLPALGTLPLFVVPRLTETTPTGGLDVFGSSGGIPIPVASGGAHGGVAVSAAALALDRRTGTIAIAHELGHALGLLHTSEPSGRVHDHLTSTPECTSARDSNASGTLLPEECSGAGAENLMFWALGSGTPSLTTEQHAILNRSPLLVKWPD